MKLALTFSFLLIVKLGLSQEVKAVTKHTVIYTDTVIKWLTIEQAEAAQKLNPKKILVNVFTGWCRWCRMEDSLSYKNVEIAHYVNQNYYPVKLNAEKREPIKFNGVVYNFLYDENIFVHEFARYLLNGKLSYPGTVILDEKGHLLSSRNGYMDAYYLEAVLNYYGGDYYQQMSYKDFESDFEGKIEADF